MSVSNLFNCHCPACAVKVEFPEELAGSTVQCPSCSVPMELAPELPESAPATPTSQDPLSASAILSAFGPKMERPRVSLLYGVGLVLVAAFMLLLPVLYVALVAALAYGVYFWAIHAREWLGLTGFHHSIRVMLFLFGVYGAVLGAGVIAVFFMFKPLFARRVERSHPLALNPGAEPKLFAFIAKVCEVVGAPFPERIDLDCSLNASASFRRGIWSLFGNDLVLTIGVPLAGSLNMREFAGVLAHEFGHFNQGLGMRLSYLIRRVNGWFARVVGERDAFDLWLASLSDSEEGWLFVMVFIGEIAVGFSRWVLAALMYLGIAVSCFMLRQMEYNADAFEIRMAGSAAFESTMARIQVLSEVLRIGYNALSNMYQVRRELPQDFTQFLHSTESRQPENERQAVVDGMGLERTKTFDTHPSAGDRIRRARQVGEPGLFQLEAPARCLFNDFDAASRLVTTMHYADDLGLPVSSLKTTSSSEPAPESAPAPPKRISLPSRRTSPPPTQDTPS